MLFPFLSQSYQDPVSHETFGTGWWPPFPDLRDYTEETKEIKEFSENKKILEVIFGEKEFAKLTKNNTNIIDLLIPLLDEAIDVKNRIQKIYISHQEETGPV